MIIRTAEESDIEALLHIEQSCFGHERFDRAYIETLMSLEGADVLVGTLQDQAVSSVMVMHYPTCGRSHLLSLATLPSYQGRGISRRMLLKAEELARERGSSSISLEVRKRNRSAIRLYEGHGYATIGYLADFFGTRQDAWQMEKAL